MKRTARLLPLHTRCLVYGTVLMLSVASVSAQEIDFLSDSASPTDGISKLFKVVIDPALGRANLEFVFDMPLNQVDALACTPDARRCYAIDKTAPGDPGGMLGFYDFDTMTWTDIGPVEDAGGPVPGIVQAAFNPAGTLIAGSQFTDLLYEVDLATAFATEIGPVQDRNTGAFLDLLGADFVFSAAGALMDEAYLWTNASVTGAPSGFYAIDFPDAIPGTVLAEFLDNGVFVTGLAIRDFGFGNVLGSKTADMVTERSVVDGSTVADYDMFEGGVPYDYTFGDMSSGVLGGEPICRTAGFWSTHAGRNGGGQWRHGYDITQAAIDAAGGQLEVCGQTITNTSVGGLDSALEGLCVRVQGVQQRQLYRQLVAAALNCALSGAGSSCGNLVPGFDACSSLCEQGAGDVEATSLCIESIDCFNNGGVYDPDTEQCLYGEGSCHDQSLCESPLPELCFEPPGPATSQGKCRQAKKNDCTIDSCAAPRRKRRGK